MCESERNVVVTGFGPFGIHTINASWEAVKLLPNEIGGFKIITEEVPVCYEIIDKSVPLLWNKYNPKLVVHVGVSSITNVINLETCAYKDGYRGPDIFGKQPICEDICPTECNEPCLKAGIDTEEIVNYLNSKIVTNARISENAGRYLCEYIFYTSLSVNKDRALFVHVPPLQQPYSATELANILSEIISCAVQLC